MVPDTQTVVKVYSNKFKYFIPLNLGYGREKGG